MSAETKLQGARPSRRERGSRAAGRLVRAARASSAHPPQLGLAGARPARAVALPGVAVFPRLARHPIAL